MPQEKRNVDEWITPSVMEQYSYYVPIDDSGSKLMMGYLIAYRKTGEKLYWAKAVELANAMTFAQLPENGQYPTYWWKSSLHDEGWINCAYNDIIMMMEMDSPAKTEKFPLLTE